VAGATAVLLSAVVVAAAAFQSFSRQRGGHMARFTRIREGQDGGTEARESSDHPPRSADPSPPSAVDEKQGDFERLGTHVGTVLSAAEEAAARIKQEAQLEAKRVREHADTEAGARVMAARDEAEATKAEVERLRAEAAEWANQARAAAEAYSADRRAEAEAEGAKIVATAERQGVALRQEAERRRQALELDISLAESRLRELVSGLHDLAERLDKLLSTPAVTEDDSLIDALAPAQADTEEARA
jgi:cell division septum initiation protein DivIVA